MKTRISWQLAEFAVGLRFDDIPPKVVQTQKEHLLDGIGNGLYGSSTALGHQVLSLLEALPSQGDSSVWGTSERTNCLQAAFANGTFANIAELEDGDHLTKLKQNSCIVPAGIAVAEHVGASGSELLVGLTAGVEVAVRIAEATHVGNEGYSRGWISTSSIGQFGAAVVAGRLIGLTVEQMVHALALAGAQPCGIWSTGLTMGKRVAIGRAAENGILSAFMAAKGITGGDSVFDGEWGNIGAIISPVYEPEFLTKELGQVWRTSRLWLKCYPTKGGVHSALDAILNIARGEPDLKAEDIDRIVVRAIKGVATNKAYATFPPHDFWEAQNSLPYIIALAFIDRAFGLEQLAEARLHDQRVLALAQKVRLEHSPEADNMPKEARTAFVDVFCRDGRVITNRVDYCSGKPENPLSPQQLQGKFREVAKYAIKEPAMASIIKAVSSIEKFRNVRALSSQLTLPATPKDAKRGVTLA